MHRTLPAMRSLAEARIFLALLKHAYMQATCHMRLSLGLVGMDQLVKRYSGRDNHFRHKSWRAPAESRVSITPKLSAYGSRWNHHQFTTERSHIEKALSLALLHPRYTKAADTTTQTTSASRGSNGYKL